MTAEQARQVANWLGNTRWDRTARTLEAMGQCDSPPPATPEISISAGSGVTEGGEATFTITASPTPALALDVSLTVFQSGDYGATTGSQTVTIPTSGAYTLTVATNDDSADEADGSVSVTVESGTGYTVSATAGAATVAVADDDAPPSTSLPSLSISDGQDREDKWLMEFHLKLSEASDREITVTIEVVEETATWGGDYQINYTTTHTIDPGETRKIFYVVLRDDDHPGRRRDLPVESDQRHRRHHRGCHGAGRYRGRRLAHATGDAGGDSGRGQNCTLRSLSAL